MGSWSGTGAALNRPMEPLINWRRPRHGALGRKPHWGEQEGIMTDVRNQQRLPVIGQLSPSSIHRVNEREIRRDG